jgi:hypothetical protein
MVMWGMAEQKSYTSEDILYFGRRLRDGICRLNMARVAVGYELRDKALQAVELPLNLLGHSLHPEDPNWTDHLAQKRVAAVEAYQAACLGESFAVYDAMTSDPEFYAARLRDLRGEGNRSGHDVVAQR